MEYTFKCPVCGHHQTNNKPISPYCDNCNSFMKRDYTEIRAVIIPKHMRAV
jgi:hypothetical protein